MCIHMSPPSWISLPAPPHPTPPQPTRTPPGHHSTKLRSLHYTAGSPICFTHDSVHMATSISQFIPFPPAMSKHLFFTFASLFLLYREVHLYHFSWFLIYALIHDICVSLSDLLHSVWQTLGSVMRGFLIPPQMSLFYCSEEWRTPMFAFSLLFSFSFAFLSALYSFEREGTW